VQGELKAEALLQELHVLHVLVRGRVPFRVAKDLDLWRQAMNLPLAHCSLPGESGGRIDPVLAILHPIDAIALRIENNRVDVDLQPRAVGKYERVGR